MFFKKWKQLYYEFAFLMHHLELITLTQKAQKRGFYLPNDVHKYITNVEFFGNETRISWADGETTTVTQQPEDLYNPELAFAMCVCKRVMGNKGNYNNVFKKWLKDQY